MQYNNKNETIANTLEVISQQIINDDTNYIIEAIATVKQAHLEIEKLALENEIPILRVITHWMDLNIEIDADNEEQIQSLLNDNCYSNWVVVLARILRSDESTSLQNIHHCLTAPNWIVKPSAPLLTGLASWLTVVKIENEKNAQAEVEVEVENQLENNNDIEKASDNDEISADIYKQNSDDYKDLISNPSIEDKDIIDYQIAKAKEANEDSLIHQTIFEEIDPVVLVKEYDSTEIPDESFQDAIDPEDIEISLTDTEKSNATDEKLVTNDIHNSLSSVNDNKFDFEGDDLTNDLLNNDLLNNDILDVDLFTDTIKDVKVEENQSVDDDVLIKNEELFNSLIDSNKQLETDNIDEDITKSPEIKPINNNFENELKLICQRLDAVNVAGIDPFSNIDIIIKQFNDLIILSYDTNLHGISAIADWSKQNIRLFKKNTTDKIETFFRNGEAWSWVNQLDNCLNEPDMHSCLEDLTNALTQEEWVEPVDTDELEALLLGIKNILDENQNNLASSKTIEAEKTEEINNTEDIDYPELIDASMVIDTQDIENDDEVYTPSGLQMTWDDDTHPELLMVYLEETPLQIEELLPLLVSISENQADDYQKKTSARLAHTIKGGSAVVGITALAEFAGDLETLLDYSNKHKISDEILGMLPIIGTNIELLFTAVQLQNEEPKDFVHVFTTLKEYVATLDDLEMNESDFELNTSDLPDFILNQNNAETYNLTEDAAINIVTSEETDLIDTDLIDDQLLDTEVIEDEKIENNIIENKPSNESQNEGETENNNNLISKQISVSDDEIQETTEAVIESEKSGFQLNWDDDTHPELLMVYLEETPSQIEQLVPLLHKISENVATDDEKLIASRMAHTIKGASAIVGITALSEISYRLETLLDHSIKNKLSTEILNLLPNTADCLEQLFDAVQMQDEEPREYFSIFKKLDNYVENLEESDEPLELSVPVLPDFIVNQNKNNDVINDNEQLSEDAITEQDISEKVESEIIVDSSESDPIALNKSDDEQSLEDVLTGQIKAVSEPEKTINDINVDEEIAVDDTKTDFDSVIEDISEEVESEIIVGSSENDPIALDKSDDEQSLEDVLTEQIKATSEPEKVINQINAEEEVVTNNTETIIDSVMEDNLDTQKESNNSDDKVNTKEAAQLEKLETSEDITNITEEINSIVMNLVTVSSKSKNISSDLDSYLTELQRFDLMADISGYPELSLLSQWCQANIELFAKDNNDEINNFVKSGEVWSWIEFVGSTLNNPDDMSYMSSLSVELMRDDWAQAIEMDDLQTVLLALRNIEETSTTADAEFISENTDTNEIISWDRDVHPELLAVYFNETPDQINQVSELLHLISKGESNTEENKKAARIAHTIKGASGVVGLNSLVDLTHSLEDILDYSVNHDIPNETAELLAEASDCMEDLFESIRHKKAAPAELSSVLERLSVFSAALVDKTNGATKQADDTEETYLPAINILNTDKTIKTDDNDVDLAKNKTSKVDMNQAYIRVPVNVIDKLINLAGELVTTSSQVSDNLTNTLLTNKSIRTQDERVHNMLTELTNTIIKQEKDQQHLLSSLENSDFDSLEMDTYNELHSVASLLSEGISDSQEIDLTLNKQLSELRDKLRSLDKLNKDFSDVILSSRMVSINTIIPRLERIVRQTCRKTDKKAQLVVKGNDINIDTDILNGLVDPLLHMLRNSIDHGIETPAVRKEKKKDETGLIELSFMRDGNNIIMSLKDDGAGIDPEVIYQKAVHKDLITVDQELTISETLKLILQPGFTTQQNITDISGRGVGMDVVNSSVESLNGSLTINSEIGEGTTFNLLIPVTLITNTILLVKAANNIISIPTDTIEQILYQEANTVKERDGTYFVEYEEQEIEIKSLGKLLRWPSQENDFSKSYSVLIIKNENQLHAVHIDSILSSREVVVKPLNPWISSSMGVIGACHLTDGGVSPVINLLSVIKQTSSKENSLSGVQEEQVNVISQATYTSKILVVDDSLSNRKALSLIIDRTNYDVITAVDGMDALRVMNENDIDLVFTDLEMPRMNGLELTQAIRAWTDKSKIPIVMITSRTTSKHRELAAKAGVDDYLTKPVVTEVLLESIDTWIENISAVAV